MATSWKQNLRNVIMSLQLLISTIAFQESVLEGAVELENKKRGELYV